MRGLVMFLISTAALLLLGPPVVLEPLGDFDRRSLPEASGIVKSRKHPGIYWVHNDSGNPPLLFAVRRDGRVVREFKVAVPNLDWEEITADDAGHLYLGDIGNNGGLMAVRALYQIDEPDPGKPATAALQARSSWFYRFPQTGRFDAEGMFLQEGGKVAMLISKRLDGNEAELFAMPIDRPSPLLRPATPRRVGSLAGFVEPATGASLSADGGLLAVCASTVTRVYRANPGPAWRLLAEVHYPPRAIEGICWDGLDLLLVSEGQGIDRLAEATWRRSVRADLRSELPDAAGQDVKN